MPKSPTKDAGKKAKPPLDPVLALQEERRKRMPTGFGRPTKYGPAVMKKAGHYYREHVIKENLLPTLEELAIELEVSIHTVTNWCKVHKEFLAAVRRIKTLQRLRIIHSGMAKDRPTMDIFMLKSNHHMLEPRQPSGEEDKAQKMRLIIEVEDQSADTAPHVKKK
jgi:hypothetical protein